MKFAYDVHLHSILSPCADELMTPNNILNMAMLNELDIIAITDHNSTKQLHNIKLLAESYDYIIIPGVEVSVAEKFDCLCYFPSFDIAIEFNQYLENNLTNDWQSYTKENQIITDIYDNTFDYVDKPLTETKIPYKDLYEEVHKRNGICILAHINRPSCSPLNAYDLKDIPFDGLEIAPYNMDEFIKEHPEVKEYKLLHNSDSHSLLQMHSKDFFIDLPDKSIHAFLTYFKGE